MTLPVSPDIQRLAIAVIEDAARRPILDVEYHRFEGRTETVAKELERLKAGAVAPNFKRAPKWHAAGDVLGISIGLTLMPLIGIFALIAIGNILYFMVVGSLLLLAMAAMGITFYRLMFHTMEIYPVDGKFGSASPDQAYLGLALILRDLVRNEGYGYKLVRAEALIAHNYGFTVIPSEASEERLHFTALKHYDSDELRIQITRAVGEKRPTYLKFKKLIEDRLARQAL
jgi:hypothetical protein